MYLAPALGRQQVFARTVDRLTLAETVRQISFSQQGDFASPLVVDSHRARTRQTHDSQYTRGALGWRETQGNTGYLDLLLTGGQSGSAGAAAAINAGVVIPQTIITAAAPLAGSLLMFNGGSMPHQLGHGPTSATTALNAGQIASLADARAGTNPIFAREDLSLGAGEVIAGPWGYGGASKLVVAAIGHGSSSFSEIFGSAGVDAQPWQNAQAMVARLAVLAAGLGLTPRIAGFILNGHESNAADSIAAWKARLAVLRDKLDALAATISQTMRIPLVLCQVGAPDEATGLATGPCLGSEEYARENRDHSLLLPMYFTDQGDYATVHYNAAGHRLIGEKAGHLILDHMHGGSVHLHVVSALRSGQRVTLTMSEPVVIDAYGVTDPGQAGIAYKDNSGAVVIDRVTASGASITLDLATVPTGTGETVSIACDNAKNYPADGYYGLGRSFGQRSCVRAAEVRHWSQTSGRPLYDWAAHRRIPVTVS